MLLAQGIVASWDVAALLESVFGPDRQDPPLALYQVAARAAVVYVGGLMIVRIGKGRLIGRVTALDIILGFILGSLLSDRGITGHASMAATLVASAALVFVHFFFTAWACRSHAFGNLIKGRCYVLVENGQIDRANMRRAHMSHNDLLEEMRLRGVDDLRQVKLAYHERSGEISVIRQ